MRILKTYGESLPSIHKNKNMCQTIKYLADGDVESFVPRNGEIYICNLTKNAKYNLNDKDLEIFHKLKVGKKIKFQTINIGKFDLKWNLIWDSGKFATVLATVQPQKRQNWYLVKDSESIPMYKLVGG
jgi:hypothetical protein